MDGGKCVSASLLPPAGRFSHPGRSPRDGNSAGLSALAPAAG